MPHTYVSIACRLSSPDKEILAQDPDHRDAWFNLGHVMEDMSKFKEACACIQEALRLNPEDGEYTPPLPV